MFSPLHLSDHETRVGVPRGNTVLQSKLNIICVKFCPQGQRKSLFLYKYLKLLSIRISSTRPRLFSVMAGDSDN